MPLTKPALYTLGFVTLLGTTLVGTGAIASPLTQPVVTPKPTTTKPVLDLQQLNPLAKVDTGSKVVKRLDGLDLSVESVPVSATKIALSKVDLAQTLQVDASKLVTMTALEIGASESNWASGLRVHASFSNVRYAGPNTVKLEGSKSLKTTDWGRMAVTVNRAPAGRPLLLGCTVPIEGTDGQGVLSVFVREFEGGKLVRWASLDVPYTTNHSKVVNGVTRTYGTARALMTWEPKSTQRKIEFHITSSNTDAWWYGDGACVLSEISA